jgi:hypothetical protein
MQFSTRIFEQRAHFISSYTPFRLLQELPMRPLITKLYPFALIAALSGCMTSPTPPVAQNPTAVPPASAAPTVVVVAPATPSIVPAETAQPTAVPQQPTPTAQPQPTTPPAQGNADIRQTGWQTVLANDPMLKSEPGPTGDTRPYYITASADVPVGGHPLFNDVLYVDMNGDGGEEAVIPLHSGGTAGNIGFFVYRQASPAPTLVASIGGYKQWTRVEDGKLVGTDALYTGWEGNCCPSAFRHTTYALEGDQLQILSYWHEGRPGGEVPTAQYFYNLLDQQRLEAAYDLLAIGYQQANPYDQWAAGFASTTDVEATVTPGASTELVNVELTATDTDVSGQGQTRRFSGTWEVRFDDAIGMWRMSNPQITPTE